MAFLTTIVMVLVDVRMEGSTIFLREASDIAKNIMVIGIVETVTLFVMIFIMTGLPQ